MPRGWLDWFSSQPGRPPSPTLGVGLLLSMVLTGSATMADVDVVEVRDCPVCGEPMQKVLNIWFCAKCSEDEDQEDQSD